MHLVQSYESVVRDNQTGLAARVMVIPRRSLSRPLPETATISGSTVLSIPGEAEHIITTLGAREITRVHPDQLIPFVAGIVTGMPELSGSAIGSDLQGARMFALDRLLSAERLPFSPADLEFAKALVEEPLVPFEQSPLGAVSLAGIARAGAVATGTYVGFIVAGSSPLLLITVPAGMIICGAAWGIGEGLRRRFESLLSTVPQEPPKKRKGRRRR
jgi:hypothetical protein